MSRRNPFEEIEDVFERMNRELSELGEQFGGELGAGVPVDVIERDEEVVVVADLPGFDAEAIDVSLAGRDLTINAERESDETVAGETDHYHRQERRSSSVHRQVRLPAEVADDGVTASYENGVLTVTLPTVARAEGTEIEVD